MRGCARPGCRSSERAAEAHSDLAALTATIDGRRLVLLAALVPKPLTEVRKEGEVIGIGDGR